MSLEVIKRRSGELQGEFRRGGVVWCGVVMPKGGGAGQGQLQHNVIAQGACWRQHIKITSGYMRSVACIGGIQTNGKSVGHYALHASTVRSALKSKVCMNCKAYCTTIAILLHRDKSPG